MLQVSPLSFDQVQITCQLITFIITQLSNPSYSKEIDINDFINSLVLYYSKLRNESAKSLVYHIICKAALEEHLEE